MLSAEEKYYKTLSSGIPGATIPRKSATQSKTATTLSERVAALGIPKEPRVVEKQVFLGRPGKNGADGKDGKDGKNGKDGLNGRDGRDGKDGLDATEVSRNELLALIKSNLPEVSKGVTAEDVIKALKELKGNDRLDISNIRNGEQLAQAANRQKVDMNDMRWHGSGGSQVSYYDISSLLDSSTKTFTIPAHTKIIQITSSSAPFVFRPIIDYTDSRTTVIFDPSIDAPSMLAAGQSVIVLYIPA